MSNNNVKSFRNFSLTLFVLCLLTVSVSSFSSGRVNICRLVESDKLIDRCDGSFFALKALKEGAAEKIAELRLQQTQLGDYSLTLKTLVTYRAAVYL